MKYGMNVKESAESAACSESHARKILWLAGYRGMQLSKYERELIMKERMAARVLKEAM